MDATQAALLLVSASLNGAMMYSRNKFEPWKICVVERAALAKKEMDYWLSEAEEMERFRETSDPSRLKFPVQLDLCATLNIQGANEGKWDWSNVPEIPQEAKIWQSNNSSWKFLHKSKK